MQALLASSRLKHVRSAGLAPNIKRFARYFKAATVGASFLPYFLLHAPPNRIFQFEGTAGSFSETLSHFWCRLRFTITYHYVTFTPQSRAQFHVLPNLSLSSPYCCVPPPLSGDLAVFLRLQDRGRGGVRALRRFLGPADDGVPLAAHYLVLSLRVGVP